MNQREVVLKAMRYKGVTQADMYHYGITRLPARIFELKALGFPIGVKYLLVNNRYGKTVRIAKYYLS